MERVSQPLEFSGVCPRPQDGARPEGAAPGAGWPALGVSTGVFARFPDRATPEAVAEAMASLAAEVDVFEVLMFGLWKDPLQAARTLAAVRPRVAVVHAEKRCGGLLGGSDPAERRHGQELVLQACDAAAALGAAAVNIHLWDLPDSDRCLQRNLGSLEAILPEVWGRNVRLLVETIPCQRGLPWDNVDLALDAAAALAARLGRDGVDPPLGVTVDLEFLAWHDGIEPLLGGWLSRRAAAVGNVHVKDYDGRPFGDDGRRRYINPGDGGLDFARIFGALRDTGYTGALVFEGNVTRAGSGSGPEVLAATREYLGRLRRWRAEVWGRERR